MADNIKVGIDVTAQTDAATKQVKNLKDLLTQTAQVAGSVNVGGSTSAAGRTPSAASRSAPRSTAGAAMTSSEAAEGSSSPQASYNRARGAIGTGAAARDFAKESEGLGGLVRVYATFAANIFAATAAFRALSNAMDTTNMVKGLDQLGASSGMALGSLSKDLVKTADGAISLREAMDAVAKSSSAGLSSTQILRLGEAAKKASQALGLSMPDAISRLSRGIAKIEPELLDELGIYVKIEEATRSYALALGKPVSALSDFERRQGFANAVLDQAEKKFNNIKIDSNPYSKLSASLQNLAFNGLSVINEFLGPVVKILSESPVALLTVVGLIGKSLLGQAIPALGQYRLALKSQNEDALKNIEVLEAQRAATRSLLDTEDAMTTAAKNKAAFDKTQAATAAAAAIATKDTKKVLSDITGRTGPAAEIADLDRLVSKKLEVEARLKVANEQAEKGQKARRAAAKELAVALGEVNKALEEEIKTIKRANEIEGPIVKPGLFGRLAKPFTKPAVDEKNLAAANVKAARTNVLENVSKTYDAAGVKAGFKSLFQGIDLARQGFKELDGKIVPTNAKMGNLQTTMTLIKGTGTILTGVVGTLASAFSAIGPAVAIAAVAIGVINTLFTTNAKQSAAASEAFDRLASASKTVDDMFTNLSTLDPLARFSTDAIVARSTALNELATTLGIALAKVQEQIAAASPWDKFVDNARKAIATIPLVRKLFDKDAIGKQAEATATAVSQALKLAGEGLVSKNAEDAIRRITGVSGRDVEGLGEVLVKFPAKAKLVTEELNKMNKELAGVAGRAKQMDEDFKQASKTLDTILVAAIPTDPLAKLGMDIMKLGQSMSAALKDPITALEQLQDIARDTAKLRFLDPQVAQQFVQTSASIKANVTEILKLTAVVEDLNSKMGKIESRAGKTTTGGVYTKDAIAAQEELKTAKAEIDKARNELAATAATQQKNILTLQGQSAQIAAKGAEYIRDAIANGAAKAALSFQSTLVDSLGNSAESIKLSGELQKQQIDLDNKALLTTLNLIDSQERLRLTFEEGNARDRLQDLYNNKSDLTGADLTKAVDNAKAYLTAVREAQKGSRPTIDQLNVKLNLAKTATGGAPKTKSEIKQFQESIVASSQIPAAQARAATESTIDISTGKKRAIDFTTQKKLLDDENKKYKEQLDLQQEIENLRQQDLDTLVNKQAYLTKNQQEEREGYELNKLNTAQEKQRSDLANEIAKVEETRANRGSDAKTRSAAEADLLVLRERQRKQDLLFAEQTVAVDKKNGETRTQNLEKQRATEREFADRRIDEASALGAVQKQALEDQIALQEQKLEFENSIGALTEKEYNTRKLSLVLSKIERDTERQQAEIKAENAKVINKLNEEAKKQGTDLAENQRQVDAQTAVTAAKLAQIDANKILLDQQANLSYSEIFMDIRDKQKLVNDIGSVISDALFEGGKGGSKKIRKLIQDELTKPFKLNIIATIKKTLIDPLVSSFNGLLGGVGDVISGTTSIGDAVSNFSDTASSLSKGMSSGISKAYSNFATSNMGAKFGLSAPQAGTDAGPMPLKTTALGDSVGAVVGGIAGAMSAKGIQDFVTELLGGYKIEGTAGKIIDVATMIGGAIPVIGPLISGIVGGTLNGLFGRKLKDSGVSGTFGPDGFEGQTYQRYKGGAFRSNKTKRQNLSDEIEDPISDAFRSIKAQTAFFATSLGQQTAQIQNFTATIKFSTKKMSQEQIAERFQQELNKIAESMAATVLAGTNYRKSGETNVQTLEKLGTSLVSVNQVFKELKISTLAANLSSGNLARTIVDLVGGLDQFNQLSAKYYDNFYTDTEKFANTTSKVNEAFKAIGLSVPKSREEFKKLVTGLDKSKPTYAATFASLLKISDAFAEITPAAADLTGSIEDLGNSLQSTIDKLKGSIQGLKEYREALLGGELSTLTPGEKYNQAKSIALETARVAQGPARTESEIAARDAALSKLPASTDAWLNASRIMYASSDKYTQDFTQVLGILDATSSALSMQLTDSEKQLRQLETSTGLLTSIQTNTLTTAQLLQQYLSTPEGQAAARAVAAQQVPGVTTPQVSNQLVQTISVLETQITKLNEQIKELRTEQQQQTTQVVIATYDANNRNADEVTAKYEELWNASNWSERSAVAIV